MCADEGLVGVASWHLRRDSENGQDGEFEMVQRCGKGHGSGTRPGQFKPFSPVLKS